VRQEAINKAWEGRALKRDAIVDSTYRDILSTGKQFRVPAQCKRQLSRRAKCGQPNQVLAMLKRTGR
jgi:hypothetical protein